MGFHNPYNFIPMVPRGQVTGELGDHAPAGHALAQPDETPRFVAKIKVTVTTKSPLLLLEDEPTYVDLETGKDLPGKPEDKKKVHKIYAPRSSFRESEIRGMLRSAYEAVTNSRMSTIGDWDRPLGFRRSKEFALELKPARFENGQFQLLESAVISMGGSYAEFVYDHPDRPQDLSHGESVVARIQGFRKYGNGTYPYMRVTSINRAGDTPENTHFLELRSQHRPTEHGTKVVTGWFFRTGSSFGRKHDERVFYPGTQVSFVRAQHLEEVRKRWTERIRQYTDNSKPNRNSRTPVYAYPNSRWEQLIDGQLCYVRIENNSVVDAFPCLVPRDLFEISPLDSLDRSLRPASSLRDLSPADRLFGWAPGNNSIDEGYKGHVSVRGVTAFPPDSQLAAQLVLKTLGQPKPSNVLFYGAKNELGMPVDANAQAIHTGLWGGLRGRKVFPHQHDTSITFPFSGHTHWHQELRSTQSLENMGDLTSINGHPTRHLSRVKKRTTLYCRLGNQKLAQLTATNSTITGWTKPGAECSFVIDMDGVSEVELGALLYVLTLSAGQHHKAGRGKPLGFGSISLSYEAEIHSAQSVKEAYLDGKTFTESAVKSLQPSRFIEAFKIAFAKAYPTSDLLDHYQAYLNGYRGNVHYPRQLEHQSDHGFEWFVKNNQSGRIALPSLKSGRQLEYNG